MINFFHHPVRRHSGLQGVLRILLLCCALALISLGAPAAHAQSTMRQWRDEGWRTEFSNRSVDLREIVSGGPPRDGIRSIDQPRFQPVSAVVDIGANEPVVQLVLRGEARAYPLRFLIWHEIVNDLIGGQPIAITYCPLCNSSVVYNRRVDGRVLEFGVSGLLRHSDMIMYDRSSHSWWQQFTGDAIVGAYTGRKLETIPSRIVSFSSFLRDHPSGLVLAPPVAGAERYGTNPYLNYDERRRPFPFYEGDLPEGVPAMSRVIVVRRGEEVIAVALDHLRRAGVLTMSGLEMTWSPGVNSALNRRRI